jgi:hypothetical protein
MTRALERVPVVLNHLFGVMAGLVPAIYVFLAESVRKTWMPATSAGMTLERWFDFIGTPCSS